MLQMVGEIFSVLGHLAGNQFVCDGVYICFFLADLFEFRASKHFSQFKFNGWANP